MLVRAGRSCGGDPADRRSGRPRLPAADRRAGAGVRAVRCDRRTRLRRSVHGPLLRHGDGHAPPLARDSRRRPPDRSRHVRRRDRRGHHRRPAGLVQCVLHPIEHAAGRFRLSGSRRRVGTALPGRVRVHREHRPLGPRRAGRHAAAKGQR